MRTVDPIDIKILEELKKDGRKSFKEIKLDDRAY